MTQWDKQKNFCCSDSVWPTKQFFVTATQCDKQDLKKYPISLWHVTKELEEKKQKQTKVWNLLCEVLFHGYLFLCEGRQSYNNQRFRSFWWFLKWFFCKRRGLVAVRAAPVSCGSSYVSGPPWVTSISFISHIWPI